MTILYIFLAVLLLYCAYGLYRNERVYRFRTDLLRLCRVDSPDFYTLMDEFDSVSYDQQLGEFPALAFRSLESYYEGTELLKLYRASKGLSEEA